MYGGVGSRTTMGSVIKIVGSNVGERVGGEVSSSMVTMEEMYPVF